MSKSNELSLRILKRSTCPTLSGKSKLTYQISCNPEGEIFFRISANSGGGFFSDEWVAWKDIRKALEKATDPLTSLVLYPLFKGKSVNTPSFLLAALVNEKVLQTARGKKRHHTCLDLDAYEAKLEKLAAAKAKKRTPRKQKP